MNACLGGLGHMARVSSNEHNALNPVVEAMHLNFREMRHSIDSRVKCIQSMADCDAPQSEIQAAISDLQLSIRIARSEHLNLTNALRARDIIYQQYENSETAKPENKSQGIYLLMQIANHLTEMGQDAAVDKLMDKFPALRQLVDYKPFRELNSLVTALNNREYASVVQWCRRHRTALTKLGGGDLEYRLQLMEFVKVPNKSHEKLQIIRKLHESSAFSSMYRTQLNQALAVLYGPIRLNSQSNARINEWDLAIERLGVREEQLREYFKKVYHLPQRNSLFNQMMLGVSLYKTKMCLKQPVATNVVNREIHDKICNHITTNRGHCPACMPWMEPVTASVPSASFSESSLAPDLVKTPSNYVISYSSLEEYMKELWPEEFKDNQIYDISGALESVDSLKTVFAL